MLSIILIGIGAVSFYLIQRLRLPTTKSTIIDYTNYLTLPDKPSSYAESPFYVPFKYLLPVDFLREGDV